MVDNTDLLALIEQFRLINTKDEVTPQSLGALLRRIAEALDGVVTDEDLVAIKTAIGQIDSIRNAGVQSITFKSMQSTARLFIRRNDNSNVYCDIPMAVSRAKAGLMSGPDKFNLDSCMAQIRQLRDTLAQFPEHTEQIIFNSVQIAAVIRDGALHILGASELLRQGYVPYLFRLCSKRNKINNPDIFELTGRKHGMTHKGWCLYGSMHTIRLNGTKVLFRQETDRNNWANPTENYAEDFSPLLNIAEKNGSTFVRWGKNRIFYLNMGVELERRNLKLPFAIAFAKPFRNGKVALSQANMVSNLVRFSIIYDARNGEWKLSHE